MLEKTTDCQKCDNDCVCCENENSCCGEVQCDCQK